MFYNDPKFRVNFFEINFPGKKSTPFSRLPKKSLDRKPLKISTVFGELFDFVEINLKVLVPVQPFGQGKSCKIQGIISGQVTGNAGNIQNICSKVWCFDTIRFVPHQKPFVFYHTKSAYQSDMLIIPFDLTVSFAPSNRIYPTCYLLFFVGVLRYPFDLWPVVQNDNQPLTFEHIKVILSNNHIQTTSLNEVSKYADNNHSLIYGSEICYENIKNKHREAMTINDYSSMFSIFKMHKKYAFSLKCKYVYISYLVYVYIKNCLYGFDKDDSP